MSDFKDNSAAQRFELQQDGHLAFARYRRENGVLFIDHVEAAPPLRGTGAAGRLMEKIMDTAHAEQLEVRPVCGYAAAWIRRHSS